MEDPATTARLAAFRTAHPSAKIGRGQFDTWQALIPEDSGETFAVRDTLPELLDRLDVITGAPA
jgi:hypothetical protein